MRPVICLVTDRRRAGGEDLLVARVAAAARAGVDLIQVRERDLDGGPLMQLVRRCVDAVRSTRTRVLVNDRLDVALAAGAHGVHLRGDSLPAARARSLAPRDFLIGRSVHALDEVSRVTSEGGLDYVIVGAVFPTTSKRGNTPLGISTLSRAVRATTIPVLAIGGVTPETVADVSGAGAAGFAAIGLFADAPLASLHVAINQAALAFDTPAALP